MRVLLVALAVAVAALAQAAPSAEAKDCCTYILTGGDLGAGALAFRMPTGLVDPNIGDPLVGRDYTRVEAPSQLPTGAYGIYSGHRAYVNGSRQPNIDYYPQPGLIRLRRAPDAWFRLAPATVTYLNGLIERARTLKASGDLAQGVVAAAFESAGIETGTYSVRRELTARPPEDSAWQADDVCPCPVPAQVTDTLIMDELVPMLSVPPRGTEQPEGAVLISWDNDKGYGALGCYAPPHDGRPGRFWYGCPPLWQSGQPFYHETTPGFDAIIQETIAQQRSDGPPVAPAAGVGPLDAPAASSEGGALVGLLAVVVGGTGLAVITRLVAPRQRKGRRMPWPREA
jgi:hypothetical protein